MHNNPHINPRDTRDSDAPAAAHRPATTHPPNPARASAATRSGQGKTACHCKNRMPAAKLRIEHRISLQ
jgi:hypothetical protein